MADFASEGGHWYLPDGTPYYTVIGANGKERPATLRDARKVGAYPGVTGVIAMAARPGLEVWLRQQVLLAALTLPRLTGESEQSYLARVMKDAQEQGKKAAERGTEIHGALEKDVPSHHPLYPWYEVVTNEVTNVCGPQQWKREKSYAYTFTDGSGYGCKIDLHSDNWVIDYKGKDDDVRETLAIYDEHAQQLAANRRAARLPGARCAIVFFGRQTPWAKFMEVEEEELKRGWDCFSALFSYWISKNRYFR